jgi:pimeloyl-ACP methyl ester carboxylesterase
MSKEPGTLLSAEDLPTSITGARAWRVRYSSQDLHDLPHEVTGIVIAPVDAGTDLPILTWCHGTTGLGDAACPSAQPDPARELTTYFTAESSRQIDYGIPGLQRLIDAGWVVCATDYQGLGTAGMHQYMVNRTNARDAVNMARVVRALVAEAGTRLGCMGWSQGGGTAAAVAELDAADFAGLRLVGTVPMSPGVPSIALRHPAGPAAALVDPSTPPDSHLVMMLCGFQAANPSALALADVLTPLGESIIAAAWNDQPVHHLNDTLARLFRLRGPILCEKPGNQEAWTAAFAAGSAAQRRPSAPVLVCVDSFDGGTVVPVVWQQGYVDAITALGGTIEVRDYPKDDHFSLPQSCLDDALAWLQARL